jgi:asparagine synthetase B (glutamine-hydrolysing)
MSQLGAKVKAVAVGFREFESLDEDEAPVASRIASYYGFEHKVRYFSRSEFESDLPNFFDAMDQPTVDGVNTWLASKAATECGYKVVLSGVGGDELFTGIRSPPISCAAQGTIGSLRHFQALAGYCERSLAFSFPFEYTQR